ncbi:MAG: hypothetical protein LBD73_09220 [Deferribacteraceae bacterium]|nr:hypothetical protein [Deferribacteraceae bacterium]
MYDETFDIKSVVATSDYLSEMGQRCRDLILLLLQLGYSEVVVKKVMAENLPNWFYFDGELLKEE